VTTTARDPIALTVIGGFLGAGKTTLLNALLRDAGDRRLAVLVNDFGAINIDAELIESREGEMVTLTNGCICCGVSGDFLGELALLRDRDDPPEHVVVEASGVADPGAIVGLGDMPGYRRDAAVVVADAETVRERAGDDATRLAIMSQLRAADLLVLNKTDLVEPAALAETHAWLREIAGPSTAIVETSHGAVPADVALGVHAVGPAAPAHDHAAHEHADHDHDHDHGHDHPAHPAFETWSWAGEAPISGTGLVEQLKALPDGVVRAKGLLALREDPARRYVLQLVGRRYSIEADRPWGDGESPATQLVVIGLPGSVDPDRLTETMAQLVALGA
jgi:G3E family GTPase